MLRLGHATETTAAVWFRHTSGGLLQVVCNGQTFSGDTLATGTDDGSGVCNITGLTANTSYPFSVLVAGVEVDSGTLRTMPSAGSTFTIGTGYCFHSKRPHAAIDALRARFDLAMCVFLGDNVYLSSAGLVGYTDNGVTVTDVGKAGTYETESAAMTAIYAWHRFFASKPEMARLYRDTPMYFVSDDHERPGDNWDWTTTQANVHDVWALNQTMVDDMGLWCRNAMHAYWKGGPENTDANRDTAWETSKQLYYDTVVGDAHLIFLEGIEYYSAGNVMTEMLGATQYAWLQSRLLASTSEWKIIFCGVPLWNEFGAADNVFNTWLQANGITVIWFAGDLHAAAVANQTNLLAVRAGPCGAEPHTNLPDGYTGGMVYKQLGHKSDTMTNQTAVQRLGMGYITVNGADHLDIGMIGDDGSVFWKCRFDADGYGQYSNNFG